MLDFQSDPPGYRYVPDALLEIDVERYLQRVSIGRRVACRTTWLASGSGTSSF